jgi:hypothetical protein
MKQETLDIDVADRICKYFFRKYKDFWNFRHCNYYTVNSGYNWCLKKDGVILSVSKTLLTICYWDFVGKCHMEIYKVPSEIIPQ